jgi:hypothetical protein
MTPRQTLIENTVNLLTRDGTIPANGFEWFTVLQKTADYNDLTWKYFAGLSSEAYKPLIATIEKQARANQANTGYKVRKVLCWGCGKPIGDFVQATIKGDVQTYNVGFRDDKHFCGDACKAQYHRENGSPHLHVDLPKQQARNCEVCGTGFYTNDYADREGLREPKFCSPACRQKAYRLRKKQAK